MAGSPPAPLLRVRSAPTPWPPPSVFCSRSTSSTASSSTQGVLGITGTNGESSVVEYCFCQRVYRYLQVLVQVIKNNAKAGQLKCEAYAMPLLLLPMIINLLPQLVGYLCTTSPALSRVDRPLAASLFRIPGCFLPSRLNLLLCWDEADVGRCGGHIRPSPSNIALSNLLLATSIS